MRHVFSDIIVVHNIASILRRGGGGAVAPMKIFNSLFAKYKSPVCHIILGHTGIGATFRITLFNSLYLFTCKLYGTFQKGKLITHAESANQKQW